MQATRTWSHATTVADAQRDLREAYLDGGPGMLVSASAWAVAALMAKVSSIDRATIALFVGGMLIHPVSIVVLKLLQRSAAHARGNVLGGLALATTFWMLLMLPLAYVVSRANPAWFFPAMCAVIGGRYLCFAAMYGRRIYWSCGAALALAAHLLVVARAEPWISAAAGAAIEAAFGVAIVVSATRRPAAATA